MGTVGTSCRQVGMLTTFVFADQPPGPQSDGQSHSPSQSHEATCSRGHCLCRTAGDHLQGTQLKLHALSLAVASTWHVGPDAHTAKCLSACRSLCLQECVHQTPAVVSVCPAPP